MSYRKKKFLALEWLPKGMEVKIEGIGELTSCFQGGVPI